MKDREQRLGMADRLPEFEQAPREPKQFVIEAITDVGGAVARWAVRPATKIDRDLLVKNPAEALSQVEPDDPSLIFSESDITSANPEILPLATSLLVGKARRVEEDIALSPKEKSALRKFEDRVLEGATKILAGVGGKRAVTGASTLALLATACSSAITPPDVSPTPTIEPTPANVFEIPSQEEIVSLETSVQAKLDETFPNIGLHETRMQGGGFLEDSLGRRYALFETLLPDPSSGFNLNLTLLSEIGDGGSISWVKGLVLDTEAPAGEFVEFLGVSYDVANNQFVVEGPLIRTSTISGDIDIYRENSWQPLLGPNETVDRVYARLGSGVLAAPALPTPTPERVEVSLEVTEVLNLLDYSSAPEIFSPENYQIEEVTFQEEAYTALVHTNPDTGLKRTDGMLINVGEEERWIRGLYYKVPDDPQFGGFVIDAIFDSPRERAILENEMESPQVLYEELLRAIAHQKGISYSQIDEYLENNDYVVEGLRLPTLWNPDGFSGSRSPSYLIPSDPVTVDLKKPVFFLWRSKGYRTQGLNFSVIPDEAPFTTGDSRYRRATFIDNESLYFLGFPIQEINAIFYSPRAALGSEVAFHPVALAGDMMLHFELLARMSSSFRDTRSNSLIERLPLGKDYSPGTTVIDRDRFWTTDPEFTKITYSIVVPTQ